MLDVLAGARAATRGSWAAPRMAIEESILVARVLRVANGELLALVARQPHWLAHVHGDGPFVSALTQQWVNGLDAVPACTHNDNNQHQIDGLEQD